MRIRTLDVYELNSYIRKVLNDEPILENISVRGEVSNFKIHSSGNVYLSLKDEKSKINCMIFKSDFDRFLNVENGSKVVATGYISTYVRDGIYQLYIKNMDLEGKGDLYKKFLKMKEKLEQEGLFSPMFKKKIPTYPSSIGVVTSSTGAVIKDIINVVKRRYPKINIRLYPVLVQGPESSNMIVEGIEFFNKQKNVDTIIVGRGGGSLEELWSFNKENVARAVFNSEIPIISAVGHETDFTICDFVADMRAPTPSAAAELATPNINELKNHRDSLFKRISQKIEDGLRYDKQRLDNDLFRLNSYFEKQYFSDKYYEIDRLEDRLERSIETIFSRNIEKMKIIATSLGNLNPFSVMDRGYCVAEVEGRLISSVENLEINQKIEVVLKDGSLSCSIEDINKKVDAKNIGV